MMKMEDAVSLLDELLGGSGLSDLQILVFRQAWEGKTYGEIAAQHGYGTDHVKHVGSELWQKLSEKLGERVTKSNFRYVLERRQRELGQPDLGLLSNLDPCVDRRLLMILMML